MPENKGRPQVAAAAARLLEELQQLGVETLAMPRTAAKTAVPAPPPRSARPPVPAAGPAGAAALADVAARVAACTLCELCETRTTTVPGEGPVPARLLFVGEAPGADEDASGRPFVGAAGQLLTRIVEQGMGLAREQVFIANVLKCRPPRNRDPRPEEKAACTPYLEEQIAILAPDLILALGRHAANHLLGTNASLGSLRGRLHSRPGGGPPVLVTFHPAYLLRDPAAKGDCWQDIQIAMQHLGIPVPARSASGRGK
ncbi:MAG TPA: uracil-DNA glycosylase [Planctomycetota bacterium]